jgi:hypothetical protein
MIDDLVHGHRQRGVEPLHHHAEGVADEQHVDARLVENPRERIVVGGEHGDLLAMLALEDLGYRHLLRVHGSVSPPESRRALWTGSRGLFRLACDVPTRENHPRRLDGIGGSIRASGQAMVLKRVSVSVQMDPSGFST